MCVVWLQAVMAMALVVHSSGAIMVSEVAYKGSGVTTCSGKDWVELYNDGNTSVDLDRYVMHDDKGPSNKNAKVFSVGEVVINAGEYKVLCNGIDFEFGIGGSDVVTLLDASSTEVSTSGMYNYIILFYFVCCSSLYLRFLLHAGDVRICRLLLQLAATYSEIIYNLPAQTTIVDHFLLSILAI
jgi:hypothetical protein